MHRTPLLCCLVVLVAAASVALGAGRSAAADLAATTATSPASGTSPLPTTPDETAPTTPVFIPAPGASPVRFGIGDQHPLMFTDRRWEALGLRITRYNVPWDAADDPEQLARVVAFVTAARSAHVETLVHLTGRFVAGIREPLPSRAQYRRAVRKLIAILRPLGVRTWGAWNEANHSSQPTNHSPTRAAQFFLELRAACRGCTIVAADVLTQGAWRSDRVSSYRGYLRRFLTALGPQRRLVRVIGIHNYGELIARYGAVQSRDLIAFVRRSVPRARFWITESGGVAATRSRFCSESRQVVGTQRMFAQAASLAPFGVERLYMYNWTAGDCDGAFDSGLIRKDGSARPAMWAVKSGAARFSR